MASSQPDPVHLPRMEMPPASPSAAIDQDDDHEQDERAAPRKRSGRLIGVASSLLRVHYEIAEREAAADRSRIVRGIVFFALSFFLLLLTLLVGQALLVCWLRARGLSDLAALGITAGADALLGLFCLLIGRAAMKAPVLPQTRAMVRRTMSALLSPE